MFKDPIVAEVRAAGDRLARRFNYDLRALFEFLKEEERKRLAAATTATEQKDGVSRKRQRSEPKAKKRAR